MQKSVWHRVPDAKFIRACSRAAGIAGLLLSLLLAVVLLAAHGNPAILLIWLAATSGTLAFARFHHRWSETFARILCAKARPRGGRRATWNGEAQDVMFRELPN